MHVIRARNVNDAYAEGLKFLYAHGIRQRSRGGDVIVSPVPVTTVYARPHERILWNEERNANPFFHLAESLWMLAGWNDARWLDQFVHDFSSRFAETNGNQHGAYGFRWRQHFDLVGGRGDALDQLNIIVAMLLVNSLDRQAVLTMWDPMSDLRMQKKDIPCNTHAYFRVREQYLDITVCCRSNDLVWGAYGANAVHFSILQEYMAARLNLRMGFYYQISNNFHGYTETLPKTPVGVEDLYRSMAAIRCPPVWTVPAAIDDDLVTFFEAWGLTLVEEAPPFKNAFLSNTAWPMLRMYKRKDDPLVDDVLLVEQWLLTGNDWQMAAALWLTRRAAKRKEKSNAGE